MLDPDARGLGLVELSAGLQLSEEERDVLLLALAPDLDLRFGRLFGFLNNDATARRPTLGQLELALGGSASWERLAQLGVLLVDERSGLPLAARPVRTPDHVATLARTVLDVDGTAAVGAAGWDELALDAADRERLAGALALEIQGRVAGARPLVLLEGARGAGRRSVLLAAAGEAGAQVVDCDLAGLLRQRHREPLVELAGAALRARAQNAILAVRSDGTLRDDADARGELVSLVERLGLHCFLLVGRDELGPGDLDVPFVRIELPAVQTRERRAIWAVAVAARALDAPAEVLDDVASRYDLTPGRIFELADELAARSRFRGAPALSMSDVREALEGLTTQRLMGLARVHTPDLELDELVLTEAVRERLAELIDRVRHRYRVLSEWRFGRRSARGHGVSALFAGPPGTGKTAAAGAIASALDTALYVVDLSSVVSKWVGETEHNLARIFDEAEASNVALLFDEADSLFGKRSAEMHSATDRFANLTVNYLLQRMESYAGLAILTTNLESALDTAFSRRITSRIVFASPDTAQRALLWQQLAPAGTRFTDDVDVQALAREYEMPGARIRGAIVRAAFNAAAAGRPEPLLTQRDLRWAAAWEYQDMGHLAPAGRDRERP